MPKLLSTLVGCRYDSHAMIDLSLRVVDKKSEANYASENKNGKDIPKSVLT